MDTLKDLIFRRSKSSELMRGVSTAMAIEHVNSLFVETWGKNILEQVKILHIKNKILTVACLNPALANEIKFLEPQIIEELNKIFGNETVESIKFML